MERYDRCFGGPLEGLFNWVLKDALEFSGEREVDREPHTEKRHGDKKGHSFLRG